MKRILAIIAVSVLWMGCSPKIRVDRKASPPCLIADGAECNLVAQCGCSEGLHCQARGEQYRPTCVKPGDADNAWGACRAAENCPSGQTCERGICKPYCYTDADCGSGSCVPMVGPDGKPDADVRVCWKSCTLGDADGCGPGTKCRSAEASSDDVGTYCVAPSNPCPTTHDGKCDELGDDRTCAEGTDLEDCNCHPKLLGAICDPVAQCGCDRRSTCNVLRDDSVVAENPLQSVYRAECVGAGERKADESCAETSDCEPGTFCNNEYKACTKFCSVDAGCGDDKHVCAPFPNPDDPTLGYCMIKCDRKTGKPCPLGSVCADFTSGGYFQAGSYCTRQLSADECPRNFTCDAPEGTGLCVEGSDRLDCVCSPPTANSVCNPVEQCGCEDQSGTQCQHTDNTARSTCQPKGTQAPYSLCSQTTEQCPPGYLCDDICRPYCETSRDCGDGSFCLSMTDDKLLGACWQLCDFNDASTCPQGLVCQRIYTLTVCNVIYETCPADFQKDGVCDDLRGSRLCLLGGDPEDCGPTP